MSALMSGVDKDIEVKNSQEKYDVKLSIREWKRYPEYKNSGVEWIGEIPKEWVVKPLKFASKLNPEILPENTDPNYILKYIDIGNVSLGTLVSEPMEMKFCNSPSRARKIVKNGDIIISTVRTYLRAILPITDPDPNLIVSTGFAVIRSSLFNNPKYVYYAIRSTNFIEAVMAHSEGVGYPAINTSILGRLSILVPSPIEQQAIVNFLDRETSKIDALIEKKQLFIELLEEKRSVLISHAVTKGLDSDVKMRHSRIEWIGEIPEHWKIISVRNMIRSKKLEVQDGNHGELHPKTEDYVAEGIPFIMANDIKNRNIDFHSCKRIPVELATSLRIGFSKSDDVLLTHKGTVGEVAIVPKNIEWPFIMLTPQVTYYRVKTDNLLREFLFLFLQSKAIKHQLNLIGSHQSTRNYVGILAQGDLLLLIPPIEEQSIIYQSLREETEKIDTLINKISSQIEKLKEYRTALISAAVTGKIDVREEVA